jgi:hypothetical protein
LILHRLVAVGRHLATCVVRARIFVLVVDHVGVALFSEVHLVLKVVEEGPVNLLLRIRQTILRSYSYCSACGFWISQAEQASRAFSGAGYSRGGSNSHWAHPSP